MKQKRMIKQLMAMGLQRNDATGFVRAYRRVVAMGREDLFPLLVPPEAPRVVYQHYPAMKLHGSITVTDARLQSLLDSRENLDEYLGRHLAREIAGVLFSSGAVQVQRRRVFPDATEIRGTVHVVVPMP